jgi:hypothetical protein
LYGSEVRSRWDNPRRSDDSDQICGINMAKVTKLCGATCPNKKGGPDFECELEEGHRGKHLSAAGGFWNDGGAQRLREERRLKIEAEPF